MLRSREQDGGAALVRRVSGRRPNPFDALFFPALSELSLTRGLMSALAPAVAQAAQYVPNIELSEQDGNYVIDVAIPGFSEDDIEVEVTGNEVTITGTYQRRRDDQKTHYTEMQQASFVRTVTLPQEVDVDRVTATVNDGILHIVSPPVAKMSSRKVSISGHDGNGTAAEQKGSSPQQAGSTSGQTGAAQQGSVS
jgi:HSP20 family protein